MPVPVAPVVYSVRVNGQPIMDTPLDVELRMSWGMHDMWFIRLAAPLSHPAKHALATWPRNAPVEILWGRGGDNMLPWYGYVDHHRFDAQEDSGTPAIQVTYVVLGTSKPMNSQRSRSWESVTAETIAAQIAAEYRLRCIATPTGWVLDHESQAAESDFQFLNRLACKTGRRFWVSGGTLYFIDPAVLLSSSRTHYIPQYRIDKLPGRQDSARDFHLLNGDQLPGQEIATRSIYGFDQNGNIITAQAGGPQDMTLIDTTRVARSYAEAAQYASAAQARSQFWLRGYVEVFGYTLLYPGKVISLAGDSLLDEAQGFWIVTGVRHLLRSGRQRDPTLDTYITRAEIVRNTDAAVPVMTGVHQIQPEIITCTLLAGSWAATRRGVSFDAMVAAP